MPALFLPSILGCVILSLLGSGFATYEKRLAITNLLLIFNIVIVVGYQAHLSLGFIRASLIKSKLFKWNTLIPVIFFACYFVYVFCLTANGSTHQHPRSTPGPMIVAKYNWSSWLIQLLLIHAFINFYFINNMFVAKTIREKRDSAEQQKLTADFLIPMRTLVKTSIWIIILSFLVFIIIDIKAAI